MRKANCGLLKQMLCMDEYCHCNEPNITGYRKHGLAVKLHQWGCSAEATANLWKLLQRSVIHRHVELHLKTNSLKHQLETCSQLKTDTEARKPSPRNTGSAHSPLRQTEVQPRFPQRASGWKREQLTGNIRALRASLNAAVSPIEIMPLYYL